MNGARGLRETVVRALARVGLVWALAVLGMLFVVGSAGGRAYGVGSATPSTAGLVLLLVVLAAGATVLVLGATRDD